MDWYHVTPLFLVPSIARAGGLRCGADLTASSSPRRASSCREDDTPCDDLGGHRPADCILLFRTRSSSLLDHKLIGHRSIKSEGRPWNAYPHARLVFSAERVLRLAGAAVYGSACNVGRTIKQGLKPSITVYRTVAAVTAGKVEEVMIPAHQLVGHDRKLPLSALDSIEVFSTLDRELLREQLFWQGQRLMVTAEEKPEYASSQKDGPGARHLALTREYFTAMKSDDLEQQRQLLDQLAGSCFD